MKNIKMMEHSMDLAAQIRMMTPLLYQRVTSMYNIYSLLCFT